MVPSPLARCFIAGAVGAVLASAALSAAEPVSWPGQKSDGSVLLPNQWTIRPTGRQVAVGDFPVNLALHPDGKFLAVLDCGYSQHEVRILDVRTQAVVARQPLAEAFYGLAWSPDGRQLYASGASAEVIHVLNFKDGQLTTQGALRLRAEQEHGVPAGLTVSPNGKFLYVAEAWGQRVLKVSATSGKIEWQCELAPPLENAVMDHEGVRQLPSAHPEAPFPYTCVLDAKHHRVYVSLWAKRTVLVLDEPSGQILARWPVGEHPNAMLLSRDGRLFVAESNRNTVSILDPASGHTLEQLSSSTDPSAPPGSMPIGLALSPDGELLFIANANNNNVAVFSLADAQHSQSLGFIPVGWFPTAVRVSDDGRTLLVANGKGDASAPNPRGPFPGDPRPRSLQEYIGSLMKGTVSFIALPAKADRAAGFARLTELALQTGPHRAPPERSPDNPIPAKLGAASPIQYVFYIIRENRTYDQVLGDLGRGNGDPALCLFGENVTPNAHALAREFTTLDNFYADGEVSADGHEWTMGAYASDFVEKAWPLNYGHNARKKYDYPAEGHFPVAYPSNGYLWNRAAEAGVSYRSYGEFVSRSHGELVPTIPILKGHIDPGYHNFDLDYPDVQRAARFISELHRYETEGDMPRLQVIRLGNDHTAATRAGKRTPTACVADNDLALGQIVEALSHSRFWPQTAIFVLEDDAQNGPDHVDAHRIPAFVISPYTRRQAIDSSLYSTTSMLRTMELILGLQPMSQFDAAARPMFASFQATPDLTGFTARPARVDLNAINPDKAWGAKTSAKMDFRDADRVDDIVLNEIVWRSVRGADSPMPAPVRAAFYKAHPKTDDDD